MENLFRADWSDIEAGDLIAVLSDTFRSSRLNDDNTVSYPNADEAFIKVSYKNGRVAAITPGQAFDAARWETVAERVNGELLESSSSLLRNIAFCHYRVDGHWRSDALGLQLLPPPPQAPDPDGADVDYPFVLEYPVATSSNGFITNQRDEREYRRLTRLLNVLLEGQINSRFATSRGFWALARDDTGTPKTRWVHEGYVCEGFTAGLEALSDPEVEAMPVVPADDYYAIDGFDISRGLQVPDTLEASIKAYRDLTPEQCERFDIACYWGRQLL